MNKIDYKKRRNFQYYLQENNLKGVYQEGIKKGYKINQLIKIIGGTDFAMYNLKKSLEQLKKECIKVIRSIFYKR